MILTRFILFSILYIQTSEYLTQVHASLPRQPSTSTFPPIQASCRLPSSARMGRGAARSARWAKRPARPCPGPAAASRPGSTASAATPWAPPLTAALPYGRPPPPTTAASTAALLPTAVLWPWGCNPGSTTPAPWSKSCCRPCLRIPPWHRKAG